MDIVSSERSPLLASEIANNDGETIRQSESNVRRTNARLHHADTIGDPRNSSIENRQNDKNHRHISLAPVFSSFAGALRNPSQNNVERVATHDSGSTKSYDAVKTSFENESETEDDRNSSDDDKISHASSTWKEPVVAHTLHPDFDVSVKHLEQLFNVLDTNGDGELTYAQMKLGFESMNAFPDLEDDQLESLIVEIDTDNSGTISLTEFVVSMHEYAALALGDEALFTVFVHDYGPSYYKRISVASEIYSRTSPVSRATDVTSRSHSPAMVSIGMQGQPIPTHIDGRCETQKCGTSNNSEMLLRVATRVNLPVPANHHEHQGRSYESSTTSGANPFVASQVTLQDFLSKGIFMHEQTAVRWVSLAGRNASVFVRIANKFGLHPLAITDVLEDRQRAKLEVYTNGDLQIMLGVISLKENRNDRVVLRHINIFLVSGKTVFTVEKEMSDFMPELMNRVKYSGSKLRLNDARYLVHALIDSSVDQLVPIIKMFSRDLHYLYKVLHGREKETFGLEHMKRMQSIYRQVTQVNQWLRPLIGVIKRLKDQFTEDKELGRYVADLLENVETTREQVKQMEKQAKSLNDDFVNQQQYRMNKVMYFLTMVTTIFIPGQFLSGVYGMNFDNMPELHWHYGYYIWWVGVLGIITTALFAFYRYRWLGTSESLIF